MEQLGEYSSSDESSIEDSHHSGDDLSAAKQRSDSDSESESDSDHKQEDREQTGSRTRPAGTHLTPEDDCRCCFFLSSGDPRSRLKVVHSGNIGQTLLPCYLSDTEGR